MEARNYAMITSQGELENLVAKLAKFDDPIGFDIETGYHGEDREKGALLPEYGFIVGFSISGDPRWARYVPIAHDYGVNLDPDAALGALAPLSGRLVAHNSKFERRFLRAAGYDYEFSQCTMTQTACLGQWQSNGLKELVREIFGHEMATIDSLFPKMTAKQKKSIRFNILDQSPEVVSYACEDAAWCLALDSRHRPLIQDHFIYKLEMQLQDVVIPMEEYGVHFDWSFLSKAGEECQLFMASLEAEINADFRAMTGKPVSINLGSPQKVAAVLYGPPEDGGLGIKQSHVSHKTGKPSTGALALNAIRRKYPVVQKILWWKELKTLHSRYLDKWPRNYSYAEDGRSHPNLFQTAAITGRVAVDGPPYQQTPKKYHYELTSGKVFDLRFRMAVTAAPGHYLVHFDYSQVELRAIAGAAREPTLLQAFVDNEDVHVATAALMLGLAKEDVTDAHRDIGKTMNYALMYQMGPKMLAERLNVSLEEGKELYDRYFATLSSIAVWVDRAKQTAKDRGFAVTHFGRRCPIWELRSSDPRVYSKGERLSVNAPIQGWAADYMKVAWVRQHKVLESAGLLGKVHLIMQNHDALTYEVDETVDVAMLVELLNPAVTPQIPEYPPITAEWAYGRTWGDMTDIRLENGLVVEVQSLEDDDPFDVDDPDEDDDDGEAPAAIQLDLSLLKAPEPAVSQPQSEESALVLVAENGAAQRLVCELRGMPSAQQADKLIKLLKSQKTTPGSALILRTPEGDVPFEWDAVPPPGELRLLFPGAVTYVDEVSVDASVVMSGLQL